MARNDIGDRVRKQHKLRFIRSGASRLDDMDAINLQAVFALDDDPMLPAVLPTYSMSESMPNCSVNLEYNAIDGDTPNTVGKPLGRSCRIVKPKTERLEGESALVRDHGGELTRDEGELEIKGPGVMPSYLINMRSERDVDWNGENWYATFE